MKNEPKELLDRLRVVEITPQNVELQGGYILARQWITEQLLNSGWNESKYVYPNFLLYRDNYVTRIDNTPAYCLYHKRQETAVVSPHDKYNKGVYYARIFGEPTDDELYEMFTKILKNVERNRSFGGGYSRYSYGRGYSSWPAYDLDPTCPRIRTNSPLS